MVEDGLARHRKIVAALEEVGAVDLFYVIVDINDHASSGFRIGSPEEGTNMANTGRFHRILGAVEEAKVDVIDHLHSCDDDEEDEE